MDKATYLSEVLKGSALAHLLAEGGDGQRRALDLVGVLAKADVTDAGVGVVLGGVEAAKEAGALAGHACLELAELERSGGVDPAASANGDEGVQDAAAANKAVEGLGRVIVQRHTGVLGSGAVGALHQGARVEGAVVYMAVSRGRAREAQAKTNLSHRDHPSPWRSGHTGQWRRRWRRGHRWA